MLPDEWFAKARDALTFARAGFVASGIPGFACFLAHQAAELALKGFLAARGNDPPRLHDLLRLADGCREADPSFAGTNEDALLLNPWYIPGRYPVHRTLAATAEDAGAALAAAARLLTAAGVSTNAAVTADWWLRPGALGCDSRTGVLACGGPQPSLVQSGSYSAGGAAAVALQGSLAYLGRGSSLDIVHLSAAAGPARLGTIRLPGRARDLAVAGNYAFVAADASLAVLDVADPRTPAVASQLGVCGAARHVALLGSGLAAVETPTGVTFVDASVPGAPVVLSRIWLVPRSGGTWEGAATSGAECAIGGAAAEGVCRWFGACGSRDGGAMDALGSRVVVARGDRLVVIDAAEPTAPSVRDTVDLGIRIDDVRTFGRWAYVNGVGRGRAATSVVDLAASPPSVAGTHDVADWVAGAEYWPPFAVRVNHASLEVVTTDEP